MKYILCIFLSLILYGCSFVLSKLYGVKNLKSFDKDKCEKFINSIDFKNIPHYTHYIDSISFRCYYSINKKYSKDLYQPIQILYFRNDSLVSFHANCYAKGSFTHLNWNYDNKFKYFIPKSAVNTDSIGIQLSKVNSCFNLTIKDTSNKIYIYILWTRVLEKVSYSAIQVVINNIIETHSEDKAVIYLINNDQFFVNNIEI